MAPEPRVPLLISSLLLALPQLPEVSPLHGKEPISAREDGVLAPLLPGSQP